MTARDLKNMEARAVTEARRAELVRSFLIDLEHEYSREHRMVFQAHWGLPIRPRPRSSHNEVAVVEAFSGRMLEEGLMYARKWFGVDSVDEALGTGRMKQAA